MEGWQCSTKFKQEGVVVSSTKFEPGGVAMLHKVDRERVGRAPHTSRREGWQCSTELTEKGVAMLHKVDRERGGNAPLS